MKQYKMAENVTVMIDSNCYNEIQKYAHYAFELYDSEIAGWAHYDKSKGIYKLAPLQSQIASGAEVETFPMELLSRIDYDIQDMNVQWHSHVAMSAFWSQTDEQNIRDTIKLTGFLISIVVNVFGDSKCRIDMLSQINKYDPELQIQYTFDCDLQIVSHDTLVRQRVMKKLKKPVQKPIVITKVESVVNKQVQEIIKNSEEVTNKIVQPEEDRQQNLFQKDTTIDTTNSGTNKSPACVPGVDNSSQSDTFDLFALNEDKLIYITHSSRNGYYSEMFNVNGTMDYVEWVDCDDNAGNNIEKIYYNDKLISLEELVAKLGLRTS